MTATTTATAADRTTTRLLAGVGLGSRCVTLAEHLERHGALPRWAPARRGRPGALVTEVEQAGLRGRGGGWFPTDRKLRAVVASAARARRRPVVIANGMEGEPASEKDAVLLHLVPHLVLDGLVVAAEAVGAREAALAVHRGSPAEAAVRAALAERDAAGGDGVTISLVTPPARYVASEESALSRFVGEGVALPTSGPRPYERGVRGRPTLVQNVETLAHLALIARYGAAWFRGVGDPAAPGTTLVTVTGAVHRPGVVEVATGTSVRDVVRRCGGASGEVAALLTGGYGGAWLGPEALDLPWSPDPVRAAGGVVGAGILVVLPDDACLLAETARVARWLAGESAGQCGPCRFGLPSVADDVVGLVRGSAGEADLARLRRRLELVAGRGACKHPDGAARFVASALRVAHRDVAAHTRGVCLHGPARQVLAVPSTRPSPVPAPGKDWR